MGIHHSNLERKESKEKCTRRKSQQKKKDSDGNSRHTYQQSTSTATDSSQKSLTFRFKPKLFRKRSTHSSSDKINHHYISEVSTVHSDSLKNKFFNTKRKSNKQPAVVVDDEEGSVFLCPSYSSPSISSTTGNISNRSHTLDDDDPMIAAATKLSARFDEEQAAILSRHSFSPCMVTQHLEYRLDGRCDPLSNCTSSNSDGSYYSHTNSIQSNHSFQRRPTAANQITDSLRPLPKQDSVCQKLNKEWLNTSLSSVANQKNTMISSQDVFLDLFLRPNNEVDRRKEKDRQQRLHYLLKWIWKGIYRAKLDKPKLIVNWCCGIGVWDMEMALLFPDTKIIGVDFKEATLPNLQHDLPNLEFRHTVIHDTYTGLESFESDSVDYIMMRDVWLINTPAYKWENVLKEALRILMPGGWIELIEHTLCIESQGPCTSRLDDCFGRFFTAAQVDREIASKLGQYLTDVGFHDVNEVSMAVPLGEWGSTHALKESGYLFRDVSERRIRGLSKWLCIANHIGEKELNNIITIGMDEELNTYHSHMNWVSYTARKKVNSSTPVSSSSKMETDVCSLKGSHYLDDTILQSTPLLQVFPPSLPLAPSTPPNTESSSLATAHMQGR